MAWVVRINQALCPIMRLRNIVEPLTRTKLTCPSSKGGVLRSDSTGLRSISTLSHALAPSRLSTIPPSHVSPSGSNFPLSRADQAFCGCQNHALREGLCAFSSNTEGRAYLMCPNKRATAARTWTFLAADPFPSVPGPYVSELIISKGAMMGPLPLHGYIVSLWVRYKMRGRRSTFSFCTPDGPAADIESILPWNEPPLSIHGTSLVY